MNKHSLERRFVSVAVILCFLVTLFPFGAFAQEDNSKPTDLTPLYVDDFSDGEIAPNITMYRNYTGDPADTLTESDGKLTFERKKWIWYTESTCGEPAIRIYANEDHTPVSDKLFMEFKLSKTREVARMRFADENGNYVTQISWEGNNFAFGWRDSSLKSKSKSLTIPASETVKIGLCADFSETRPRFYLWINDELQVNGGFSACDLSAQNFSMFSVYTLLYSGYTKAGTLTVSELGIYKLNSNEGLPPEIDINDEQVVDSDITWLTQDLLLTAPLADGYLIDHLSLDSLSKGANGSDITWASSDESIIALDGTLTRPDSDTDVTLTAIFENKTVQKEKTFTFKVPGKSSDVAGIPGDITPVYYDNFADSEISDAIVTSGFCDTKPADTLTEEDSKLTFLRKQDISSDDEEYGKPAVRFVVPEEVSPLSGKLLAEFVISKSCDILEISVGDGRDGKLTDIIWSGNSFNVSYRSAEFEGMMQTLYVDADDVVKVSIYSDFSGTDPYFSIWLNNEKAIDNVVSLTSFEEASMAFVEFCTYVQGGYTNTGSYTVDNVGVYSVADGYVDERDDSIPAGVPNQQRVDEDLAAIDGEMLLSVPKTEDGYVVDPLDLDCFTTGENGSDIVWKSSHPDIITPDGSLVRPANDTEVTVTAVASFGDAVAEKSFTYNIAGTNTDIDGMRTDIYPLYFDSFSDGKVDKRIESRNIKNTDSVFEKNGKMVLRTTSWASHEPGIMIYKDINHNTLSGEFIVEFTLTKTCDILRMRTINAQWNYINQIYWVQDNFNIYYRDDALATQTLTLDVPSDQSAKVTIYVKTGDSSPKFTMWVNNKKVLENVNSCTNMSPSNIQWVQIYTVNTGSYGKVGDSVVDNFGYYQIMPDMTDAERVKADADALTDESLIKTSTPLVGYAYEDLELSGYGVNGSRIIWESSMPDVIATDGTVTRADSENIEVTLTAKISSGAEKMTKTFKVIILGKHVDITDMPAVEEMITENDYESEDIPNLVDKNLTGGGSVEIKDGVLNLIKTGDGTAQVGTMVYTGSDTSMAASGVIGLEYDIERAKSGAVQIRSMDANGNVYYSTSWGSSGMSAYYSNDPAVQGTSSSVWRGSDNKIHVNMMFDTANSTYWLWVNGTPAVVEKYSRSVGVGAICYTMFYLEGKNEIKIDNYKIYNAIPPKALRLKFDLSNFDKDVILNETPQAGNIIQNSVNLPTVLRYGTNVEWTSSRPDIIDPETGELTRPIGVSENPRVELTAHLENSGITAEEKYVFYALRGFEEGADFQKMEAEDIKHSYLTDEDPSKIRTSLNLMDKGLYGSDIIWKSSDTSVITNAGRVIRPRFDEPDADVTLTATIGKYKKELTFTVLADEPPKDPMHTSDEDFFGVWDGSRFVKGPQLAYSNPELSAVEECAKRGDYAGAKTALLQYFKVRNVPSPIRLGSRHPGWVDARCDGMYELSEEASYWKGQVIISSDEYERVTASIYNASGISKIECKTFELIARYNEATSAFVLGTDADNPTMVPSLEVTVNGGVRVYKATQAATIRAGKYSRTHIDDNKELQAKMYGDFLGDETYRILLAFDLSDIGVSDKITSAQLVLYAKKSSKSADNKHLWIIDNRNKAWDEETVYWDTMNFVVHNYNGLIGGTDWKGARSSDVEFAYQMPRFAHARNTMSEYKYTGNEKYAYALLGQVMDIIVDAGDKTPYPRSLDAALRMHQWVPLMNSFKDSPYMTEEFVTAFMKYMYAQFEYFPTRKEATGNWRDYEQLAVLYATSAYPELANSASTKEICIWSWQNAFNKSYMSDGTYIEDTGGYHRSSFAMYRDFKKACFDSGTELPKEFDETLHKAAYYMVLTKGPAPDGLTLQFGDESGGKSAANAYTELADWYNDYEFRYIDSNGTVGIQPSWTSYQFPEGRYTMMRSSWKKNAIYLHTSVRGGGGGGHGHADDNSIILMGNGRRLLVDAGKMTYNSYDPSRIYGQSTQGHNTVVINDTSQRGSWTGSEYTVRGNINVWTTNSDYDFLSQTTISYAEYDHTRNILFIKDGLFVVSDLMEPHVKTGENNYKQYWHMHPEAAISGNQETRVISSNYADGKNLILVSGDETDVVFEDGFYDTSDGTAVANKAGIFEKNGAGDTTLDTIMYVAGYKDADVKTERIDTGFETDKVTALKIHVYENKIAETYYYMLNHRYDGDDTITFGDYTTDARVVLVGEDKDGNIISVTMTDGTYVEKSGKTILASEENITDISAKYTSVKLSLVTSDENISANMLSVASGKNTKTVMFNGESKDFDADNGVIRVGVAPKDEEELEDNNKNDGIKDRPSQGGAGGSGGGGGGFVPTTPTEPQTPDTVLPFTDIYGHWAADYITALYLNKIVNGDGDGTYRPDGTITRAEFTAIAIRALGADKSTYEGGFGDVKGADWFADDVQTAVNLGIISADILFRPYDTITREEMAKILSGCAKQILADAKNSAELTFVDANDISEWAREYVGFAVANGLMNGKDGNIFDAKGNATRAETATVFARLMAY